MSTEDLVSLGKGIPVFDTLIEALKKDDGVDLELVEIGYGHFGFWDDEY